METFSPLYCRYNGFTLGVFLATAQFPFARRRYRAHRVRVQEFLDEVDLGVDLPRTYSAFVTGFDKLQTNVLAAAKERSSTLRDFMGLGLMAALHGFSGSLVTDAQRRILVDRWTPVLERHGIARTIYEEWLGELPRHEGAVHAEDVLSPALALLNATLEPLAPEPDTCFVAMPFESPFTEYYASFYRPALAGAGLRAIRAWGGLSSEEYYVLLLTLITRSGSMLAELSTLNLNVINEVGVAHGTGRPVFLIGNRSVASIPSNIAHFRSLIYSRRGRQWMPAAIDQLTEFVSWIHAEFIRRTQLPGSTDQPLTSESTMNASTPAVEPSRQP